MIDRRVEILREAGEFGLDEVGLREVAESLYTRELILEQSIELKGEELFEALVTVYKGESFLRRGKRHIGTAFYPEPGILSMSAEKKKIAIDFIDSQTFKLERDDMKYHIGCKCMPLRIGFQWNGIHQFHLIAVG